MVPHDEGMKRRTLLRAAAVAGTGVLAGCADTGPDSGSPADGQTDSPTDSPTETPTESPTATEGSGGGSREVTDRSFEVLEQSCGQGENSATVERGDDRVIVEGTIGGSNTCYTAELERAQYDSGADRLTVAVRSYEHTPEDETPACGQCIVDINYRATVEFDDGTPDEVTVRHNGEHVTSE